PVALASSGNTLYVANYGIADNGAVGEYNALTGAAINANLISGIYAPYALVVAAVPEPSSWWMAVSGAALLGVMRRKNTARDRHSLSNRFEDW
ncbi:MAG: PEP-CTERM sorting domain-containing protein, partial [Verrucomicrobia bacterium]|nr:PEP-CTERM sorting domain-containing protein [Verrucomicrobiota bacterium]